MFISTKKLERMVKEERNLWRTLYDIELHITNLNHRILELEKELHPERFQKDTCCCCKCSNTSEEHDIKFLNY